MPWTCGDTASGSSKRFVGPGYTLYKVHAFWEVATGWLVLGRMTCTSASHTRRLSAQIFEYRSPTAAMMGLDRAFTCGCQAAGLPQLRAALRNCSVCIRSWELLLLRSCVHASRKISLLLLHAHEMAMLDDTSMSTKDSLHQHSCRKDSARQRQHAYMPTQSHAHIIYFDK